MKDIMEVILFYVAIIVICLLIGVVISPIGAIFIQ